MLEIIKETFLHDTKNWCNINYLMWKKYFQIPLKNDPPGSHISESFQGFERNLRQKRNSWFFFKCKYIKLLKEKEIKVLFEILTEKLELFD